ncbi:DUF4321 domain-containing protein [Paenibacillus xerothermodurans]|uniref:DUF4321 domain-containing protein n=1 Tax=Paenibacillus xerothermodurans TaxID=1977292 RepID=A0A2W1NYQ0_PAEXE|nr:DUF4321 domain-containing protein [Paenibacillus xerothermodurans]PZE19968.1 DUF4321 domain-containing protein [Paenibacillus xerothermodurans]
MKKNTFTLVLLLIIGLAAGSLAGQSLASVPALAFLTKSVPLVWQPKADLLVIKYDLDFHLNLNLISIIGLVAAFWAYRKL